MLAIEVTSMQQKYYIVQIAFSYRAATMTVKEISTLEKLFYKYDDCNYFIMYTISSILLFSCCCIYGAFIRI